MTKALLCQMRCFEILFLPVNYRRPTHKVNMIASCNSGSPVTAIQWIAFFSVGDNVCLFIAHPISQDLRENYKAI